MKMDDTDRREGYGTVVLIGSMVAQSYAISMTTAKKGKRSAQEHYSIPKIWSSTYLRNMTERNSALHIVSLHIAISLLVIPIIIVGYPLSSANQPMCPCMARPMSWAILIHSLDRAITMTIPTSQHDEQAMASFVSTLANER